MCLCVLFRFFCIVVEDFFGHAQHTVLCKLCTGSFLCHIEDVILFNFNIVDFHQLLFNQMLMEKVGKLEFPDALLKRIMRLNNQDKDEKFVEDNYDKSIEELTWR